MADELYVVWLKTVYEGEDVWTLSPPWTPIDEVRSVDLQMSKADVRFSRLTTNRIGSVPWGLP